MYMYVYMYRVCELVGGGIWVFVCLFVCFKSILRTPQTAHECQYKLHPAPALGGHSVPRSGLCQKHSAPAQGRSSSLFPFCNDV